MTLNTLIKNRKLSKFQLRDIFSEIADGVCYLHGLSIAHRDIKLDNIVVSDDFKTVKFIDFGLCADLNGIQNTEYLKTEEIKSAKELNEDMSD